MASGVLEGSYEEEFLFAIGSIEMYMEFEEEEQAEEKAPKIRQVDKTIAPAVEELNYYNNLKLYVMFSSFNLNLCVCPVIRNIVF